MMKVLQTLLAASYVNAEHLELTVKGISSKNTIDQKQPSTNSKTILLKLLTQIDRK